MPANIVKEIIIFTTGMVVNSTDENSTELVAQFENYNLRIVNVTGELENSKANANVFANRMFDKILLKTDRTEAPSNRTMTPFFRRDQISV